MIIFITCIGDCSFIALNSKDIKKKQEKKTYHDAAVSNVNLENLLKVIQKKTLINNQLQS